VIPEKLPIARIGKTVGLRGDLRLHLLSDFPEQFKKGATFMSDRGDLTVSSFNAERGTIRFEGINNIDDAKRLTNAYLYTTKEATEEACKLNEGEYFWYQIIGLEIDEDGSLLGKVEEIERLAGTDYLLVKTDHTLVENGAAKNFLIPYVERYIDRVDLKKGKVFTTGAKAILEAS
jgi:16S rRNA processing protein RimM